MSTISATGPAVSIGSGFRASISRLLSRLMPPRLPVDVHTLPSSDRRPLRESDHDRLVRSWDNSPWNEIRNQHGVWR